MSRALETFAEEQLELLDAAGRLRLPDDGARRRAAEEAARGLGVSMLDASSNDYLGLATDNVSRETGVQQADVGAGASRLIHGTREPQLLLERAIADWVGLPAALLFTSGYAANVGLLSAIGAPGTLIVSDRLNHASIIDGARLSRAEVRIVQHLAVAEVAATLAQRPSGQPAWVVTEACFSMDGDGPDLAALRELCDRHGAGLIVDEAHSLGVFGPGGAGRCRESGVEADALIATLGKALGSQGALVAGGPKLRALLWNRARSFVFSTASSPLLATATLLHVERARRADDRRAKLVAHARELRAQLRSRDITVPGGLDGPIVPVVLGDGGTAMRVAARLGEAGILAQAIRPPTVPDGEARLRLTASAAWPAGAATRVAAAVADAVRGES